MLIIPRPALILYAIRGLNHDTRMISGDTTILFQASGESSLERIEPS